LADLHHARRAVAMTEGEVAVSLAGVLTPALVSVCAATWLTWRFALVVTAGFVLAAALAVVVARLPDAGSGPQPGDRAETAGAGRSRGGPSRTLITVFAIVGLEFTLSFWAASYLHDDVGIARNTAVALVSALYAANLVGRVVASRIARRHSAAAVLRLSLVTTFAGIPLLLGAGDAVVAAAGLAVTGIGIGGTFPLASAMHLAASRRTADQALGQILAVAGLGQISAPLLAGALAQVVDLRVGLLVLPALVLLAGAMTTRVE
jgi:fucose permease